MRKLEDININNLSLLVQQANTKAAQGSVIQRIPLLAVANPNWFTVHICCHSEINYSLGDNACKFPLMSVIKPFSLLYLLEHLGAEKVLGLVGVEPSLMPFNSLEQLMMDKGHPRNSMINSGAITLADKLPGKNGSHRTQLFCQWLNKLASSQLYIDVEMLTSVRDTRSQVNVAIAQYLHQTGHIENIELSLDTYEQICCISGQVEDLAQLGKLLACESSLINSQHRRIVNALMLTCGLYEASSLYAVKIGLPMKSGISGALLATVPNQGAIACYSPALDSTGNPVAGLAFIEALSQTLQLSIFS
ncbi:glutaminase [Sphaerospermopsis aphanizomenoides BCCUSP55]|uniref:glutaminase n=1 Tax=Sphaerospermopsis aphanizomenoides TaxID=459663 RepID=UPI0019036B57|nr:glutaminase [Sphaerospermopsis aphanizomenoides]MBK1989009.1 glutaminase [Sphaerospermopsis aphanizomenoides BCCUSP55]